ncbi:MAG: NUDIX domain-containing protein [Verrucomicrobia bacterium]|nr:NUDIX domain-containing protein [Verrucomicrobiota bacterium]
MEESFGIIPLVQRGQQWFVLSVLSRKSAYWGFPKGHAEEGEEGMAAAERELQEETGLRVLRYLPFGPLHENYTYEKEGKKIPKRVTYHLAEVEGALSLQVDEVASAEWYPLQQADAYISFPEGQELCRKAALLLEQL